MLNKKSEQITNNPMKSLNLSKKLGDKVNKGTWTAEEDQKLAQVIAVHGAKRWKNIAAIAGLKRCGKSCRLRWLNYLRPNIKRGNISDQEEDLILRLHKLLGNRWSLIAGRLPGRTDNEIKNYWNSHLSKKINPNDNKQTRDGTVSPMTSHKQGGSGNDEGETSNSCDASNEYVPEINYTTARESAVINTTDFDVDEFFNFSDEGPLSLGWMSQFLEQERT